MSLLRDRESEHSARVSMVELFFDLVFVFAVTQLSHLLLEHMTPHGLAHVALLVLAVWWVWIYTSWATNWLDPEQYPVRLCLLVLMLAGLLLSVSIPQAFGARGASFAAAYAFMQVGRTLFFLWAARGEARSLVRNFQRILVWLSASALFWLIGGLGPDGQRLLWWALALAIEMLAPWVLFRVPGLGRSELEDWDVEGDHIAERCALFVIIALGESLLVSGVSFAAQQWDAEAFAAMATAVLGSILMWWIYFDTGAERAQQRIRESSRPGRHARNAYTYLHALIVAGIIVSAAGDEVLLQHPRAGTGTELAAVLGGPFCYLLGVALFKWVTNFRRAPPLSHLAGLAMLAALAWPAQAQALSPLALGAATVAILAVVAAWESVALRKV